VTGIKRLLKCVADETSAEQSEQPSATVRSLTLALVVSVPLVWELPERWGSSTPLVHVFNPLFCHLCRPWGAADPIVLLA